LPALLVTHDRDDVVAAGGRCMELHSPSGDTPCSMPDSSR
jgi:ABC-type uncharacterized transport system YnjBCD ATPase subunit